MRYGILTVLTLIALSVRSALAQDVPSASTAPATNSPTPSANFFGDDLSAEKAMLERLSKPQTNGRALLLDRRPPREKRPKPSWIDGGMTGDGEMWASIDMHALAVSRGEVDVDIAADGKVYDDVLGHKFEFKKGPALFVTDPMVANDRGRMALLNELNERMVISDKISVSQADGVIWTPFENKNIEFNMTKLDRVYFSIRF